jgi:hypothetical protein
VPPFLGRALDICVGRPAEKLDQIDVVKRLRRPTDGIDDAAYTGSQNRRMASGPGVA